MKLLPRGWQNVWTNEKAYKELQSLKSDQEQIKSDVSDVRNDIQKLGSKIDGEIIPKSEARHYTNLF